jgi:hypothetical protein
MTRGRFATGARRVVRARNRTARFAGAHIQSCPIREGLSIASFMLTGNWNTSPF